MKFSTTFSALPLLFFTHSPQKKLCQKDTRRTTLLSFKTSWHKVENILMFSDSLCLRSGCERWIWTTSNRPNKPNVFKINLNRTEGIKKILLGILNRQNDDLSSNSLKHIELVFRFSIFSNIVLHNMVKYVIRKICIIFRIGIGSCFFCKTIFFHINYTFFIPVCFLWFCCSEGHPDRSESIFIYVKIFSKM